MLSMISFDLAMPNPVRIILFPFAAVIFLFTEIQKFTDDHNDKNGRKGRRAPCRASTEEVITPDRKVSDVHQ